MAGSNTGAVYVFAAAGSAPLLTINNPKAAAFDEYGSTLTATLSGDIIVRARFKDNFSANDGSGCSRWVYRDLLWSVTNPTADSQSIWQPVI